MSISLGASTRKPSELERSLTEHWSQRTAGTSLGASLRDEGAFKRLECLGLPNSKQEEWRQTPLTALFSKSYAVKEFQPALEKMISPGGVAPKYALAKEHFGAALKKILDLRYRIVFLNGSFCSELSTPLSELKSQRGITFAFNEINPDAIEAQNFRQSLHGLVASCLAMPTSTLKIEVANSPTGSGGQLDSELGTDLHPLGLVFLSDPQSGTQAAANSLLVQPQVFITVAARSQFSFCEAFFTLEAPQGGGGEIFTNALIRLDLRESAVCHHYQLIHETMDSFHFSRLQADVAAHATYRSSFVGIGSSWTKRECVTNLVGEGAGVFPTGAFLAHRNAFIECHSQINHRLPHGTSRQLFKGIAADHGKACFRGRVLVEKDAQKTQAFQSNPNLVLSQSAQIHTKPQLEILADDVKCSHGATIGRMDENALFYLRSRGIPRAEARIMLTRAFALECLDQIKSPIVHDCAQIMLEQWFQVCGETL